MQGIRDAATPRDRRLVEGVIANLPMFCGVQPADLATLARNCWAAAAPRGTLVAARGVSLPGVFAVAYGTIKLVLRRRAKEERILRLAAARQTFGDSSALLGRVAPHDAIAVNDSKVVIMPTAGLLALTERDAAFAKRLVIHLAQQELLLYDEIEAATLCSGTQRLASYLSQLHMAVNAAGARTVQLPFSKTLVASRLGLKKETLSRLLRDLSDRGVIGVARRDISILEPALLHELAESG